MYRFQVYTDPNGLYRWRLRAPDGQIIAVSGRGYRNQLSAREAAERTQHQLRETQIEDRIAA